MPRRPKDRKNLTEVRGSYGAREMEKVFFFLNRDLGSFLVLYLCFSSKTETKPQIPFGGKPFSFERFASISQGQRSNP